MLESEATSINVLKRTVNFDHEAICQTGAAARDFGCLVEIQRFNEKVTNDRLLLFVPRTIHRCELSGNRSALWLDGAAKAQFSLRL